MTFEDPHGKITALSKKSEIYQNRLHDCEVVMMKLSTILAKEAERSRGGMVIETVPQSKQPAASTLRRIEREIAAQISANEAMSSRSMNYASRLSGK